MERGLRLGVVERQCTSAGAREQRASPWITAPSCTASPGARRVIVDQLIHAARTVVLEPDELQKVSAEQADVRARNLGYGRYRHDVCSELDPTVVVVAGPDVDLQSVYRAVEVAGNTGDRLKANRLELEKLRDRILDDRQSRAGIDHHSMGDRLPGGTFPSQELDIGWVRREQHLHERTLV